MRQARLQETLKKLANTQPPLPQTTKPSYAAVTANLNTLHRDLQAQQRTQRSQTTQGVPDPTTFTTVNGFPNKPENVRPKSANINENILGEEEQGWIKVTRKHKPKDKQPKDSKPLNPYLKQRQQRLMAQARCFKCLEKGHNKAQCRNVFKCHKCHGLGHQSRQCAQATTIPTTNRRGQTETKHHNQIHHSPIPQPENTETTNSHMELQNWETMEMLSLEYINNAREDVVRVFMSSSDTLRPTNEALSRAAVVMTGPNTEARTLPYRLAANLGMYFNRHP
ncbi:Zinc knuckle [Carex littledalei]|uniref:Zinc knuckle n=1 Tax=Carex littledalei TaxID=544730 RepID=A0A833RDL7_9POAL|nr:Zinc knuckle [Carex littledalei]